MCQLPCGRALRLRLHPGKVSAPPARALGGVGIGLRREFHDLPLLDQLPPPQSLPKQDAPQLSMFQPQPKQPVDTHAQMLVPPPPQVSVGAHAPQFMKPPQPLGEIPQFQPPGQTA